MEDVKKKLGQIDTPIHIAQALLELANPKCDIFYDIGAGKGNLSLSLHELKGVLIELDPDRYNYLKNFDRKNLQIINQDFLVDELDFFHQSIDKSVLYMSNPPFNRLNSGYTFKKFNITSPYHQLDLAFLDKVLNIMNSKSSLLFIMASPLVEFSSFKKIREVLINEFGYIEVISLEDKIYEDAEVESYAIIAHKIKKHSNCKLAKMNFEGEIIDEFYISKQEAIESLSFNFHKYKKELFSKIGTTYDPISKLIKEIQRGSKTKKFFKDIGIEAIHTTHLNDNKLVLNKRNNVNAKNYNTARKNDILISRVGKRSIAKQSLIETGSDYFTDSVIKLTPKAENDAQLLWDSISSEVGKTWREIYAQGKCAKYLTVESILNIPITY